MRRAMMCNANAGGKARWSPILQLSALHGWDVKQNVGAADSPITSVAHLGSASGANLTPLAGTKEPLLKLAFVNGKNVALYDGINDSLFTASSFAVAVAQPFWVFGLWQCPTGVTARRFFDSTNRALFGVNAAGAYEMYAGTTILTGGTHDASPHWFACLFDGASSQVWRDEVSIITGNPGAATLGDIYVGSDQTGAVQHNGYFGDAWVAAGASVNAAKRSQSYTLYAKPTYAL
jgi:hypothetical protein